MSRPLESSEEYILAAFMSGELPVELRRRIIAYLNTNEQARDMLDMAQIAMDAAESGDGASLAAEPQARLTQSGGRRTWPEVEGDGKSQWKVTAFFAGAVLVLTIIVAIMAFNASRTQSLLHQPVWSPAISAENVTLEWEAISGAQTYQVMRFDTEIEEASIIARTSDTRLMLSDIEATSETSPVWILAFDANGAMLDRSEPIRLNQLP